MNQANWKVKSQNSGVLQPVIHRAPLVVPVCGPVIENGAVAIAGDTIIKVDRFEHLKDFAPQVIDHEDSVLIPGLINCHAHLELSYLQELGKVNNYFEPGDITSWIYELIKKRMGWIGDVESQQLSAIKALDDMYQTGVVAVADIGNEGSSHLISLDSPVHVNLFLEAFALNAEDLPDVQGRLSEYEDLSWTAHAPYSTSRELIVFLKKRAIQRGELFPIHVAESAAEIEFLKSGKGPFATFLNKRLSETSGDSSQLVSDFFSSPGCGAVTYLAKLGILDSDTLCVHSVHVDEQEIDLLASHGARVCLCPASNRFLGVGRAPVSGFVKAGVKTCLGTDSLASNLSLSLWHEMETLADDHPDLDPALIMEMATINGAESLGLHEFLGSLQPGKKASILAVKDIEANKGNVFEKLVHAGVNVRVQILGENDE